MKYKVTQFTQLFEEFEVEAASKEDAQNQMAYGNGTKVGQYTKDSYAVSYEAQEADEMNS